MSSEQKFDTLINRIWDEPLPLVRLAHVLFSKRQIKLAREICERALLLAPDDPQVWALAADVLKPGVANWYFPMVRDRARTIAYGRAISRAISPRSLVLDVGTGVGLWALLAARAGAQKVITCEVAPLIAELAREIVARNNMLAKIDVIGKSLADLEIGVDLERPADVLIHDVIGSDLMGAGVLPIVESAARRFLRPEATVIPARGTIRAALAEFRDNSLMKMGVVEGFDLSSFNRLTAARRKIGNEGLSLRSEAGNLFSFDFQSGGPFPSDQSEFVVSSMGGPVNGVAQWLHFNVDDHTTYENVPAPDSESCFAVVFHYLARPIETVAGQQLKICGSHDRRSLHIWVDTPHISR